MRTCIVAVALVVLLAGMGGSAPAPDRVRKPRRGEYLGVSLPPLGLAAAGQEQQPVSLVGTGLEGLASRTTDLAPVPAAVRKALIALWVCSPQPAPTALQVEVKAARARARFDASVFKHRFAIPAPAAQDRFKRDLLDASKQLARVSACLEEAFDALERVKNLRDRAKLRWRANYDLVRAWVLSRQTAIEERGVALGMMRKELPEYDPKQHKAWQLVPRLRLMDFADKKRQAMASTFFDLLLDEHGGLWGELARQGKAAELGCEWQAVR